MRHPLTPKVMTDQQFKDRATAYKLAFSTPAGQLVMQDLMSFCRAHESCFDPDPRIHAALEGRREVWLRIFNHVELTHSQALAVFGGRTLKPEELTHAEE